MEGKGLDDAGEQRRLIEIVTKVMVEMLDKKAMVVLLMLATWIDCWAWMEAVEKTGLEFQEPVGIPLSLNVVNP